MPRVERQRTLKETARLEVQRAKLRGDLTPPPQCEECGAVGRVEAHHPDYSQPLFVRFVCRRCHLQLHRGTIRRQRRERVPPSLNSPWRTVWQAAEYLSVSPSAIYKMVQRGRVKTYRWGRHLRLKVSDLDAVLEAPRRAARSGRR